MRERPILFSAPMVRALLAGTKTQTRRVAKYQPISSSRFRSGYYVTRPGDKKERSVSTDAPAFLLGDLCPHGTVGDRLWVKETWRPHVAHGCALDACDCADVNVEYAADGSVEYFDDYKINRASPDWCMPKAADRGNVSPLFMPRWASRLILEITDVRIERLQAISEGDCCAEGVGSPITRDYKKPKFQALWESINGAESWAANPWVWALTFRRVTP